MLKRKKQYHYLEEKKETILSRLRSFKSSGNHEDLHVIRVQVKKTMALMRLYKPLKKSKARGFRIVFKAAGLVRDSSVLLKLIEKFQPGDSFLMQEQQKILTAHSHKFESCTDQYIQAIEQFYDVLMQHLKPVSGGNVAKKLKKELGKISAILLKKASESDLHKCRKRIKNLLYLHSLLSSSMQKRLELNIAYLDTLQDIIGKWHDAAIADEVFLKYKEISPKTGSKKLRKAVEVLAKNFMHKVKLAN